MRCALRGRGGKMPDDRLIHRRSLHSEKVCGLTDFEYRVWMTYELASDDYGVMRFSAAALRSANDALEHKPTRILERAFHRLEEIGLIRAFHHQGKAYCYQPDWQAWQRVRNPRTSVQPLPPLDHIEACEASTQKMFRDRLELTGETLADAVLDAATSPQQCARAHGGETATGSRLPANGSELKDRFEQFWEDYPRKVGKGAAWRVWTRIRPNAELLTTILVALRWQRQQPQWLKDGGQFTPHPATYLNQERWTDQETDFPQISEKTARSMGAIYGRN
jgi:hypothetical protein